MKTWDGRRIFVPNSIIGNQLIVNWSIADPVITWRVDSGIDYTADIDRTREIYLRRDEEVSSRPQKPRDRRDGRRSSETSP